MTVRPLLVLLAAMGPALPLAAQGVSYEGGLSFTTGTYIFTERTTSWALFTGLVVDARRFSIRASLPVYLQNTTLVSISSPGGGIPTGGSSSGVVADSGRPRRGRLGASGGGQGSMMMSSLEGVEVPTSAITGYEAAIGDPLGQATWHALSGPRTAVSASALVKVPVADTATFGTGQWDVGGAVSASQLVGGRGVVGLDVTYWHLGDLDALDFLDPVYGTVRVGLLTESGWSSSLGVTAGTATIDGFDGAAWVGGSLSRQTRGGGWEVTGSVGLTETSPDLSLGLSWRVRLTGN